MSNYILPDALSDVIDKLGNLPGVGNRTAERYAYFLLRANKNISESISKSVATLHDRIKQCPVTFALINADDEVSPLYSDSSRDKLIVAVVEEPMDIVALERTRQYNGTYHVLNGVISPIDGVGPEQLHIPELITRINSDAVEEVIIATNASVEGESTAIFIRKILKDNNVDVKVTRLARGIPVGVDLEYADQITLANALEGRRTLQ